MCRPPPPPRAPTTSHACICTHRHGPAWRSECMKHRTPSLTRWHGPRPIITTTRRPCGGFAPQPPPPPPPPVVRPWHARAPALSSGPCQVMCEVYATQPVVRCAPHIVLSLVLYKMVDPSQVRPCNRSSSTQQQQRRYRGTVTGSCPLRAIAAAAAAAAPVLRYTVIGPCPFRPPPGLVSVLCMQPAWAGYAKPCHAAVKGARTVAGG